MRRRLRCSTTRTGAVMHDEQLELIQPNPLLFQIVDEFELEKKSAEIEIKRSGSIDPVSFSKETGLEFFKIMKAVRLFEKEGVIFKNGESYKKRSVS